LSWYQVRVSKRTALKTLVAHEHRSFFFPDNGHGAANAAGFGWHNGGYYPLGGAKKKTAHLNCY
jgi:hypothetical protein